MLDEKYTIIFHKSKGPKVRMAVYVDTDHAHDSVTKRSITGIHVMLNNTKIRWLSNRQKTLDSSSLM
jgi:hypothetical protein